MDVAILGVHIACTIHFETEAFQDWNCPFSFEDEQAKVLDLCTVRG